MRGDVFSSALSFIPLDLFHAIIEIVDGWSSSAASWSKLKRIREHLIVHNAST